MKAVKLLKNDIFEITLLNCYEIDEFQHLIYGNYSKTNMNSSLLLDFA